MAVKLRDLRDLAALIRQQTPGILNEWRLSVREMDVASELDAPTLNNHIPDLLEELAREFELGTTNSSCKDVSSNSVMHGLSRLQLCFNIEEVVSEYSALRKILFALIVREGWTLQCDAPEIINRVLDNAIALAVKTFAAEKALEVQQQRHEHLSFVAHDLRTPLSSIAMATAMLKLRSVDTEPEARFLFEALQSNVGRLSGLIVKVMQEENNVKSVLGQSPVRTTFSLHPIVQACMDELKPLAIFKATELINEVDLEFSCYGNANMVSQIFHNLLSNSIKYCDKGVVRAGGMQTPEASWLWVSDNGEGIPADRIERVFSKWETDRDPKRDGMGLGLNIVRNYVEAHGGIVGVKSPPAQGTIFEFSLPKRALEA